MNPTKLTAWLRRSADGCVEWRLCERILIGEEREEEAAVATWTAGALVVDTLAAEILAQAEEDANDVGGNHTYFVLAVGEDGKPLARKLFDVLGSHKSSGGAPREEPNQRGVAQLLMRHLEVRERTALLKEQALADATSRLLGEQRKELKRQRKQNKRLADRELANVRLLTELTTQRAKHEIEQEQARFNTQLKTTALEKVDMLFPLLVSKLAGTKLLPPGPLGDGVRALLLSIGPDQLEVIAEKLKPEQLAIVHEIYAEVHKVDDAGKPSQTAPTVVEATPA